MSPLLALFLKSLVAGFVVAVPIGAIGALCLRRALQGQWIIGMITGFGAAAADTVLAVGAAFGLSLITGMLEDYQEWLRLFGGLFLVGFGLRMVLQTRKVVAQLAQTLPVSYSIRLHKVGGALAAGFGLTVINPATLLAFLGVFAGLGLLDDRPHGAMANSLIVAGVFAGSMSWWSILTGGSAAVRHHIPPRVIGLINAALGLVVATFGVGALVSFAEMTLF